MDVDTGCETEDPFMPFIFEDGSIRDSILDDIMNEESEVFLVEIEMVGPLVF